MSDTPRKLLLCSCEDTMPLDAATVARGCGAAIETGRHLCRSEIARFLAAAKAGPLTVACTQEAGTFQAAAQDAGLDRELAFVDVRETAGWSSEGANAAAKMAALIAAAEIIAPPAQAVTFESEGVTLILGRDQTALDAARRLADRLDVTVLLQPGADVAPPRTSDIPIRFGKVRTAKGYLGKFELTLDSYAEPAASSRAKLTSGPARSGAVSNCDVILDLTGGAPLFAAHDLRNGYLRADPSDPAAVERLLFEATDLVGTFDKPRYVDFKADLCAHSRSKITGCTRCLEVCPAGAITSAGNTVAIDPHICGGCGQCAAVCPTGAASYDAPTAETAIGRLRAALSAYRKADGKARAPVVLLHDGRHGADLVVALARFGDGLPAHVIPLEVAEPTSIGLEQFAAALAYGASGVAILTRAKPKHDIASLRRTAETATMVASALGYGPRAARVIETDDPDALLAAVREAADGATPTSKPASFLALGGKRDLLRLSLRELHRAAPAPVDSVPMPAGSAFGAVHVDAGGCTLCLACVSACPPHALTANPDSPQLKFDESLCVQCGLCQTTCPEKVISLEPRINFAAFEAGPRILKEEEPFCCTRCAKPFGVKSTIERIRTKLAGNHWMFAGDNSRRLEVLGMCDTCRIEVMTLDALDPYAGPARPAPRTSEDYFREREMAGQAVAANDAGTAPVPPAATDDPIAKAAADLAAREAAMLEKIRRGDV
jgi:ferredoxin